MEAWLVHKVSPSISRIYRLGSRCLLGRSGASLIPIEDGEVLPSHCVIWRDGNTYRIRDLTGCQGTLVNYQYVPETTLVPGDQVVIGRQSFLFHARRAQAAPPEGRRAKIVYLEKFRPRGKGSRHTL